MILKKTILKKLSNLNIKKDLHKIRRIQKIINPVNKKTIYSDYIYNLNNRDIKFRYFKKDSNKVIIYFHGGGWSTGDLNTYTKECEILSNKTDYSVILVDYRLAPENKYPKGLNDCYDLTNMIVNDRKFDDLILMGDSAGGNLACSVALKSLDTKDFKIEKLILLYPSLQTDYSENTKFKSVIENGKDYMLTRKNLEDYMELYVDDKSLLKDPYVSPLYSKKIKKLPKTLLLVGDKDPLLDEALEYYKINKKSELIIYEDTMHGFISNSFGRKIREQMYVDINQFLGGRQHETKK